MAFSSLVSIVWLLFSAIVCIFSVFLNPLSMSRFMQPIELHLSTGRVLEEPGFSQDAHAKLINVRPA